MVSVIGLPFSFRLQHRLPPCRSADRMSDQDARERASIILFQRTNILCRQSKAVFLLMCNAVEILSSNFCSDIRCIRCICLRNGLFHALALCGCPIYSIFAPVFTRKQLQDRAWSKSSCLFL